MSGIRWLLAAALAVLALVASGSALGAYARHGLALGVASIVALVVIQVAGLASLALARRRIGRELGGLRAKPADGALVQTRRARLADLHATGARPDLHALAEATAAEEAGRAYLGRYFVATTVLVGLVGTFAGLLETLGHVAPLLADGGRGGSSTLGLLAAPLAGLSVTFGASLVAILVTLALTLAQGDLALTEERALAALEDLTRHELVPALWPPAEEPAARATRELVGLRAELASVLAAAAEEAAKRVGQAARIEVERTSALLADTAGRIEASIDKLCTAVTEATQHAAEAQSRALAEAVSAQTRALAEASTARTRALDEALAGQTALVATAMSQQTTAAVEAGERQTRSLEALATRQSAALDALTERQERVLAESTAASTALVERTLAGADAAVARTLAGADAAIVRTTEVLRETLAPLFGVEAERLESARASLSDAAASLRALGETFAELGPRLEAQVRAQESALGETSRAVMGSLERAVGGTGERLERSASELARAASELRTGVDGIAPQMRSLSTDLAALSREVALLAAERDEAEVSSVVLTELERLGESVERLSRLVRGASEGSEHGEASAMGGALRDLSTEAEDEDELPPGETQ